MSELLLRTIEDPAWHGLLARHEPWFHQRPEWFSHLKAAFRGRGVVLSLEEKSGPVACLPAFLLLTPPLRTLFAGIPYGDVLGPARLEDEFLRAVHRHRRAIPADQLRYVPYRRRGALPDVFSRVEERIVTELPLPASWGDEPGTGIPPKVGSRLRQAARLGVIASRCEGEAAGALLHTCYAESMRRQGAAQRYPESWFRTLAAAGSGAPRIEAFQAWRADEPVAMIVTVMQGGVVHVLHSGVLGAGLSTGAAELLHVTALRRARALGATMMDFGASDPADHGLRHYKHKFKGEERVAPVGVMHLRPIRSRLAELARKLAGTKAGAGLLAWTRAR